jgi:hypothetical protein
LSADAPVYIFCPHHDDVTSKERQMKKILSILVVLTFLSLLSVPASAKSCGNFRHRHGNYWHTHSSCVGDGHKHGRSFWQKHRDKLTTAAGAGASALTG